jgi:hypothetical protein
VVGRNRGRIAITLDRYGHLFPDSRDKLAAKLDAYLEDGRFGADGHRRIGYLPG